MSDKLNTLNSMLASLEQSIVESAVERMTVAERERDELRVEVDRLRAERGKLISAMLKRWSGYGDNPPNEPYLDGYNDGQFFTADQVLSLLGVSPKDRESVAEVEKMTTTAPTPADAGPMPPVTFD